jgi:hypothetical protein
MNTVIFSEINWLAVFVGALAFFMLGALWYSKLLFVKKWLEYLNINPDNPDAKKGMAVLMVGSFLMMFFISILIAVLRAKLDISGTPGGLKLGAVTGLLGSFAIFINYLYEKKPAGLFLINGGYALVGNIISALIICNWV